MPLKVRLPLTFRWPVVRNWQRRLEVAGIAVVAAAIVHIATTLIAPSLSQGDAYHRLARNLPTNRFVMLPVARPSAQVIPFQSATHKLSICRFDTAAGPVAVTAVLPESGWVFTVYGQSGDGLYTLTGQAERRTDASVILMPTGDHFVGSPQDPQPGNGPDPVQIAAAGGEGLVVISAPIKGRGSETEIDRAFATANCRQLKY